MTPVSSAGTADQVALARIAAGGPIAMFDSGVGGLTVLHECLVGLPHEDFIYLGDTARFPYGDHCAQDLRRFAIELADLLVAEGAKLLVVACNSATAAALPVLRERFASELGVVAVVGPEAALAVEVSQGKRIGLLATPATVASRAYELAIAQASPGTELVSVACPRLATLIQQTSEFTQELVDDVEQACAPLIEAQVDTVILGCTHYPLVAPIIKRAMGRGVELVSSGAAIAHQIEHELIARELANDSDRRGSYRFLCTGEPQEFRRVGTRFLHMPLGEVRRAEIQSSPASRPASATSAVE